jgi:CubicO group peptidase (beta-lactamase class C family)
MEDFSPTAQLRVLEPSLSRHPAHTVRISARDLARFGQLYLQDGRWGAAEVVPRDWVRESLRVHSDAGDGVGYGYLWWIYSKAALGADRYPALAGREVFLARGTGGNALFLIPSAEMVVVHRADTDNGRSVQGRAIWKMVDLLVGARKGTASPNPRLRPMQIVPLASQAPARPSPALVALDAAALTPLVGDYAVPKGGAIRVFLHDGRLFANLPGHGEAELFATSATTFVALVVPGTGGEFAVGADGRAVRLRVTIGGQVIEARRR